jgi:serine/threonine protein kinase/formylglycine-generating enzyme required for sulfatase activity
MQEKIKTTCSSCGQGLLVPSELAGKKLLCKKCGSKRSAQKAVNPPHPKSETLTTTLRLDKSLSAAKKIREVLQVEPSVDLDHFAKSYFSSKGETHAGATGESVRDIISHTQEDTKYIVDKVIGEGGMGAVLGTVDQDIRRRVAMKVMLPGDRTNTRKLKRFLEEAQITGQLEHPNIVPVHEIGIDEDAKIYFTMKLVQGEDLKVILSKCAENDEAYQQKYGLGNLIQIFLKLCDGISYAHSKGVLHRDLKPENIMVGPFGEVLVMDWGVAKILGQKDSVFDEDASDPVEGLKHTLTMEGIVLGTPSYMSPEQAWGKISELDERSDVFSLGAILYQILTYETPYGGKTLMSILEKAQNHELVSPDLRVPHKHIPPELNAVCMKAMAYDMQDRYPNALELKKDLQLYLDGKSVSAKKDNFYIRTQKWIIRNKIAASGIAAALICLILGIVFTSVYESNKRQEAIVALLNQAEEFSMTGKYETAEETFFAVLGLDSGNQQAREGVALVSGRALGEKNKRLAKDKTMEAKRLFENKNYLKAYEAYVAALTLDPYSREALEGIKTAAVMAEKQMAQMKITPILNETKALSNTSREINARFENLKAQLNKLKNKTKGYEGVEAKKPLWEAEKNLFSTNIEKLKIESEIISRYMTVLSHDGANKEARIALSQIYYDKYQAGEVRQDQEEMAYYKALILTFDDGRFKKLLEHSGMLTLTTTPRADAYYVYRFIEGADRRMVPAPFSPSAFISDNERAAKNETLFGINPEFNLQQTAFTPIKELLIFNKYNQLEHINNTPIPSGSYLIVVRKQGYLDTRIPILIQRGEEKSISDIPLFKKEDMPNGFVYIPKGPFVMGGDQQAPHAATREVKEVGGYFISQHEVTTGEYLTFVNMLENRIPGSAEKYLPRESTAGGYYWKKMGKQYKNSFPEDWPVIGISWNDARAYCKWMSLRYKNKGWVFRLPEDREWEKAARGVDGRNFPWGNHFDYKFCSMANSKKDKRNGPDPVGSFSLDESVFGVRDMAGNVSEWCGTLYDQENNIRIDRGAAWSYVEENYARCSARNGHSPSDVADFRGFRMIMTLND